MTGAEGSVVDPRLSVRDLEGSAAAVLKIQDSYMNYSSADIIKPKLKEAVSELMDAGKTRIVVNLANVGVMDSCGLAVLIALKKLVDGRDGDLALSNLSGMIQRLFKLTKLDRAFAIYDTEDEAVNG